MRKHYNTQLAAVQCAASIKHPTCNQIICVSSAKDVLTFGFVSSAAILAAVDTSKSTRMSE